VKSDQTGYCIYINSFCEGPVPILKGGHVRGEAQKEIADYAITRLQQFLDGEMDFGDAISVE